jgi:hypothetical protein
MVLNCIDEDICIDVVSHSYVSTKLFYAFVDEFDSIQIDRPRLFDLGGQKFHWIVDLLVGIGHDHGQKDMPRDSFPRFYLQVFPYLLRDRRLILSSDPRLFAPHGKKYYE